MKKRILQLSVLLTILTISFAGCEKEKVNNSEVNAGFSSTEELNAEINKTITLNSEELKSYEALKGYKSYGRMCEEIYENIDFSSFTTQDEILDFVAENGDYLELVTDEYGDVYLETKLRNNEYRYIIDNNRMFTVNDRVYKVFNEGQISTTIENRNVLYKIESFNEKNNKVTANLQFHPTNTLSSKANIIDEPSLKSAASNCGTKDDDRATSNRDRTKIEIELKDKWEGNTYKVYHKGLIRPYKKTLGVWYWCTRTISYQWKYTAYVNILGIDFREGEDRSGTRSDSKEESYKELFFSTNGSMFTGWHYEKYDCWGDTPSTGKAQVKCGY